MSKRTQRERLIEALIIRGYKICEKQLSRKYIAMEHIDADKHSDRYFLGKSGALRRGKTSSGSFSVLETTRKALLKDVPQ